MCDCLETVQASLKERGLELKTNMPLLGGQEKPLFDLYRLDNGKQETRRGHPTYVLPTYCPFCGKKYAQDEGNNAGGQDHA